MMGISKGALTGHYPLVAIVFLLMIPDAIGAEEKPIRTCPAAKQISLAMESVPIDVFLREVASQGQVNIAVSRTLRGRVSAELNCVDARQALRLILGQIDAAYCDEGTVLRVDDRSRSRCAHPQPAVEGAHRPWYSSCVVTAGEDLHDETLVHIRPDTDSCVTDDSRCFCADGHYGND